MSLSIVIPVFRNEDTIMRCLESVRRSVAASQADVHIVLDGNHDRSGDLVASWHGSAAIHVTIHHQEHSGIAAARNRGLAAVRTSWVTFLDADDEMTDARMTSPRGSQPIFGMQDLRIDHGAHLPAGTRPGITPYLMSLIAPTAAVRGVGGFTTSFTHGDDLDLMIRLQDSGNPAALLPDVFVVRHIHAHNASWDTRSVASDYVAAVRQHMIRRRSDREEQHRPRRGDPALGDGAPAPAGKSPSIPDDDLSDSGRA